MGVRTRHHPPRRTAFRRRAAASKVTYGRRSSRVQPKQGGLLKRRSPNRRQAKVLLRRFRFRPNSVLGLRGAATNVSKLDDVAAISPFPSQPSVKHATLGADIGTTRLLSATLKTIRRLPMTIRTDL